jgi:GNAT superfamily N-acetyltransferase
MALVERQDEQFGGPFSMDIKVRPAVDNDADACGHICYDGFRAVNERYGFPPTFPSVEVATQRICNFIRHPSVFGVVAEADGRIIGFNFLSERDPIRAVGPIVIDPATQGRGIGRQLMEAVLEQARSARGVRLLQDTFNIHSFSLYAALGFDTREILFVLSGIPRTAPPPHWQIRPMTQSDIAGCESLHEAVHGYSRTNELRDALATGTPVVAARDGRVRAYMAAPTIWLANHGVAETEEDMRALLLGTPKVMKQPISYLMPARRAALFRWCLTEGYRAIRPMTLMTIGEYHEPRGSYFPSVLY